MDKTKKKNVRRYILWGVLAVVVVLNNSGLQVLPTTVLTLRQAAGAQHPADIWGAMLISSAAATAAGVILLGVYDKIRQKGANPHGESRRRHPHRSDP